MNILILGAGYAGLAATTNLAGRLRRRDDVTITLVNAEERFTERLRLHMTAAGRTTAELSIPELLKDTRVRFVRGRVTGLGDGVAYVDGEPLPYDRLVFALGSAVAAPDHTYTLNSWTETQALAKRLSGSRRAGLSPRRPGRLHRRRPRAHRHRREPALNLAPACLRGRRRRPHPAALRGHARHLPGRHADRRARGHVDRPRARRQAAQAVPVRLLPHAGQPRPGDAVVQFTRPDDSPRRTYLAGRAAVRYKETVTASPWPTFRRMLRLPRSASFWTYGGRYTR